MTVLSVVISLIALQSAAKIPDSYIGLYADTKDRAYMLTSGSTFEYIEGEQWGAIAGIYQAPNKDFVGTWAQAKKLNTNKSKFGMTALSPGRQNRNWVELQEQSYSKFNSHFVGVYDPDHVRYSGEIRMKFLSNSTMSLSLTDVKGINYQTTTLTYLGDYTSVMMGGVYKDKYTELNLTEMWGRSKYEASGTFLHNGKKYNVEGERLYTRGILTVIDQTNGKYVGTVIYGYAPGPSQVKRFRSGNFERTDQVFVNFYVPGMPTTQVKYLTR